MKCIGTPQNDGCGDSSRTPRRPDTSLRTWCIRHAPNARKGGRNLFNGPIQWPTVIIAIVAVYGAMLSTYTALLNWRDKTRRVAVRLSLGFGVYGNQTGPTVLLVTASNPGSRTVTLTSWALRLPDKRQLWPPMPQSHVDFPHDLLEGKSCTVWVPAREVAEGLKGEGFSGRIKLAGLFRDAVGNVYTSKPIKFDIDGWLKS
jgi:hypothetical protein